MTEMRLEFRITALRQGARVLGISVALLTVVPQSVAAQERRLTTLFATVSDGSNGAPLSHAEVLLPELHRIGTANWLGEVVIPDVPSGVHRVRVRVVGYQAIDVPILFRSDTVGVTFVMKELSKTLDTVKVSAAPLSPLLREFEQRRTMGFGRYLTEAQLDSEGTRDFETVMTSRFPGLRVVVAKGQRILASARGDCGAKAGCFSLDPCAVLIFLDGMFLGDVDADIVRTWDLAAVEFYSGAQVPVRYRISGSGCGVMLLWTK